MSISLKNYYETFRDNREQEITVEAVKKLGSNEKIIGTIRCLTYWRFGGTNGFMPYEINENAICIENELLNSTNFFFEAPIRVYNNIHRGGPVTCFDINESGVAVSYSLNIGFQVLYLDCNEQSRYFRNDIPLGMCKFLPNNTQIVSIGLDGVMSISSIGSGTFERIMSSNIKHVVPLDNIGNIVAVDQSGTAFLYDLNSINRIPYHKFELGSDDITCFAITSIPESLMKHRHCKGKEKHNLFGVRDTVILYGTHSGRLFCLEVLTMRKFISKNFNASVTSLTIMPHRLNDNIREKRFILKYAFGLASGDIFLFDFFTGEKLASRQDSTSAVNQLIPYKDIGVLASFKDCVRLYDRTFSTLILSTGTFNSEIVGMKPQFYGNVFICLRDGEILLYNFIKTVNCIGKYFTLKETLRTSN